MTVESQVTKMQYAGNGAGTQFPTVFAYQDASHVGATLRRPVGDGEIGFEDQALILGTDFSLDEGDDASGGTLTYPLSGDPLATGETLTIYSNVPLTQERAWSNMDAIDTAEIEKADDKLTRICLQLHEELGRCVKNPVSASDDSGPIAPEELEVLGQQAQSAMEAARTSEANAQDAATRAGDSAVLAAASEANAAILAGDAGLSRDAASLSQQRAEAAAAMAFGAAAPAWDAEVEYDFPDVVAAPDGHTYRALEAVVAEAPASSTKWVRITLSSDDLFQLDQDGDLILSA